MRTLVIYESKTGFTKKYAEDIASAVGGDVIPLKKFKASKMVPNYDAIVFGGWVCGGTIQGLNKFLGEWAVMEEKNVFVFGSGLSVVTKESRQNLIDSNVLDLYHLRFYQLRGSFDYSKLNFFYRFAMNRSFKMIEADQEATADQLALLSFRETPLEYYDREGVAKIVAKINELSATA